MKLSILIPVYNERTVVERSLAQVLAAPLPENIERELIIVDDCSNDGTYAILQRLAEQHPEIRLYRHTVNQGKGAAVRSAIQYAEGDFCLIQDADLEYDPQEYPVLLKPLLDGRADAVFGSRYLSGEQRRVLLFWHSMINQFLTLASNIFSNLNLTDMETCYKVFRTDLLKSIPIRSNRFGFEPEIVMKCAKRKFRIYEVPISYHGRTYEEGKKIGWRDGLKALGVILHFWLIDDLYSAPYGRGVLNNLSGTPQYLSWLASLIRPYLGDSVLELNAGIGNLSGRLMARRLRYVAADHDALNLHALRNRFLRTPNVTVARLHPDRPEDFARLSGRFDTVLCLNVLEYAEDPLATVKAAAALLAPGGRLVTLAPQSPALYGSLDRAMSHRRRFRLGELWALCEEAGLRVEQTRQLNKAGTIPWWINSRLLGAQRLSKLTLKLFDKTVWFWRRVEPVLPLPGLSLITVAQRAAAGPLAAADQKRAAVQRS